MCVISREAIKIYEMKIGLNTHEFGQKQYTWAIRCGARAKFLWGWKIVAEAFGFSMARKVALNY